MQDEATVAESAARPSMEDYKASLKRRRRVLIRRTVACGAAKFLMVPPPAACECDGVTDAATRFPVIYQYVVQL
jgi:hypothetical protein